MKKFLSVVLSVMMIILAVVPAFAASDDALQLAKDGQTDYVIVIGENATTVEITAANELASYLFNISNATFTVVRDSAQEKETEIIVGITNRDSLITINRDEMGDDGVFIQTKGNRLFLTGGAKRGALYSVYTFLEDYLGCRWFTKVNPLTPDNDECTYIPEINDLTIEPISYSFVPPFKLRQTYWMFSTMYADYSAIHKLHGVMAGIPENLGGITTEDVVNSVHTLQWMITTDLFAEHPEYFGMDENGNRTTNRQPCLSNPDVLNIVIDAAKTHFSQYASIYSVSQNDGMEFCRCPECVAFNDTHGGVDSASMLNFVNKVAAEVRKEYPEAKIETLAYQRSETPPTGLTVEENVVIRVCPINTCVLHSLDDASCPANEKFDKVLTGWSAMTDSIYVWDYSTNFQYIYAFYPNITAIQGRYQYFRDRNVIAIFDNGCGDNVVPGELHELRTYLICKLLWNPDTDVDMHIREFCNSYYGEAASEVIEFIYYFEDAVKGYNATAVKTSHMTCQDGGESLERNSSLNEMNVAKLDKIVEKAKNKNLTEDQARRVQGFEISWRFYKNATWAGEFNWFNFRNDPQEASRELYYDMKDYGIVYLSENWGGYFREEEPNFLVRPTFWYHNDADLPVMTKVEAAVYPVINKILRFFFALPNLLLDKI